MKGIKRRSNFLKRVVRRYFFTLIEVLVALSLIALVSGVFAINIRQLWRQQAFLDEAHIVLNQLRLAQDIMQVMSADVEVGFQKKEETYFSKISIKSPGSQSTKRILAQTDLALKEIGSLIFEDISGKVLEEDFVLTFFSRGFTMNHGLLKIGSKLSKTPSLVIAFSGHPQPMNLEPLSSFKEPSPIEESAYIERLTLSTRQETTSDENPAASSQNNEKK
ncbi:hypothetical protein PHSC3_000143 [Chlamydiales bacterium STE3]|nr:hypothetical protein PHSC3_000143 [Chlamydiales bacterium STE3]